MVIYLKKKGVIIHSIGIKIVKKKGGVISSSIGIKMVKILYGSSLKEP